MAKQSPQSARANRFRIIAGEWRGRRLAFPDAGGVRPTPDRVRETLFNWLGPVFPGMRALDLFAGSGALGLEALSRGFDHVTFVEQHRRLGQALKENLAILDASERGRVVTADVRRFLGGVPERFDLVFLDPPYDAGLHEPVLAALQRDGWLAEDARLYLEYRKGGAAPLPPGWESEKTRTAGDVAFALVRPPPGQ